MIEDTFEVVAHILGVIATLGVPIGIAMPALVDCQDAVVIPDRGSEIVP